ncbi:metal ABC transporter permease [Ammoniphilus sp. CFH 90114]|uniref:metal ABC transporter permease n=1 Tax=Ammoniphilus sp. CFH 90114 TaxID=2493665 RepID=UPI00100E4A7C|nr:metal ABC transporter permease [Ammoniphilus sp. CFH 90114]RXT04163.1 metal ABC transporter permease [Ammoniphilus sp. CFH 90114]
MSHGAWIILIGSLVASSCGFIGCFLILRKMSMLGDAISHAILPGIVLAFLISQSMDGIVMLVGATIVGLLTAFFIQTLHNSGVQSDAAIGVTFTALFSFGVVLVSLYTSQVHLDLQHVLYGEIAYAPWELVTLAGIEWPRAVWMMGGVFILTMLLVGLFYKEIKLASFDSQLAAALGVPVVLIHYLLMGLVSMNTVAAFESVGAILVVAMLVTPGATAYLLTDRLSRMLLLSIGFGTLASFGGYYTAVLWDVSISGSISCIALLLFVLAFFFSPREGLVSKWLSNKKLQKEHTIKA